MSAGASTAAPKVSAPALVVMPKSPTTAVPPSSLTTTFSMISSTGWSSLVIEQVTVGSPTATVTDAGVEGTAAAVGAGPVGGRVADHRELGEGVRAGRDHEGRGGVGERVGGASTVGAEGQRAGVVVMPKSSTVAVPPSSLTTVFSMISSTGWSSLVIEQVTGSSPNATRDGAGVEGAAAAVGAGPVGRGVAGHCELGEGVGAGRHREGRGGVGEGVGRGLDRGAEDERAGAGRDAEVVDDRGAAVVVDDDLLDDQLDLLGVGVRAGRRCCPRRGSAHRGVPGSKPSLPPVWKKPFTKRPMIRPAALPVQTMFVRSSRARASR